MVIKMNIDERLLAYKPISVTLNFDWENTTYDERVLARHNYIEEQKKKDPNYVGYDFPEWFKSHYGRGKVDSTSFHSVDFSRLINTLGQIYRVRKNKVEIFFGIMNVHGYIDFSITEQGKHKVRKGHRIVACTFIPIPEMLKDFRYQLVVNHKNDIKTCNLRSNLEWCTQQTNIKLAVKTSAINTFSFKYTVKLPGELFDKTYYFFSYSDLIKQGFYLTRITESISNGTMYIHGIWEKITKDELKGKQIGIPPAELLEIRDKKHNRTNTKPILVTIISEGPCKGQQFTLYGEKEIVKYGFHRGHAYEAIRGDVKTHRGCVWKHVTREEAFCIPIGPTGTQMDHIFGKR